MNQAINNVLTAEKFCLNLRHHDICQRVGTQTNKPYFICDILWNYYAGLRVKMELMSPTSYQTAPPRKESIMSHLPKVKTWMKSGTLDDVVMS